MPSSSGRESKERLNKELSSASGADAAFPH